MNDKQLSALLAISRCGSFSKASEELFVSKQALIKQIDSLEGELGFSVAHRSPTGITLTPAGSNLVQAVQRFQPQWETTVMHCREIAANRQTLRICSPSQPRLLLERAIDAFSAKYPDIRLEIILRGSENPVTLLLEGRVDVAECTVREEYEKPGIARHALIMQQYYCLIAANHPFAKKKSVDLRELSHQTVGISRRSACRELLEAMAQYGCEDVKIQERQGEELLFIMNFCFNHGIYLSKSYYTKDLRPLVSLPLTPAVYSESALYTRTSASETVWDFLRIAQNLYGETV